MSSIGNTSIAASVAQGSHQQNHVARTQDAQRNHAARQSMRLKQANEKHLESVEESAAVQGDDAIDRDEQNPRDDHPHQHPPHEAADAPTEGEQRPRVDLTA